MELQPYKTKDLHEAAALYGAGLRLAGVEGEEKQRWFVFEGAAEAESLANSYWAGELKMSVRVYVDALRTLKDRLFARK